MDMYKLKWTRLQSEIFRLFCIKTGKSLNLREIGRFLRVTPTAVSKALERLKKEGILNVSKPKTINLLSIELNRDKPEVMQLKRAENLKMIYESGLHAQLFNELPGRTIILFGSYSRGEDTISSDIDLAVIGSKVSELVLTKYEQMLEKKIIINYYESWRDIHKHLLNNILNGIVLSGGVDL